ncbi:glycine cleavage system p-protein [Ditylenchus destructor]|nr:glycine cleavage system p-protein [Ditylenchus destructor]
MHARPDGPCVALAGPPREGANRQRIQSPGSPPMSALPHFPGLENASEFHARHIGPDTLEVVRTRAEPLGITVQVGKAEDAGQSECFGALVQYPGVTGVVRPLQAIADAVHAQGGLLVAAADLLALTLIASPGEQGADIAVGTTQRFGMPMGAGGPHAAFMACRDAYKRSMPGRLIGVSIDAQGNPAYRLTLQTREQHIRREKATSNICTAQVLLAVMASMYAVYHGPEGLKRIAQRVTAYAAVLAQGLKALGLTLVHETSFDTLHVQTGAHTGPILAAAVAAGMNLRQAGAESIGITLDETTSRADVQAILTVFAEGKPVADAFAGATAATLIPAALSRTSAYLTHPIFNVHHSETDMLRYLRSLADKDLAMDRTMIPLGSCTMKLNATAEMIPITWPEFAFVHPFRPAKPAAGLRPAGPATGCVAVPGDRLCRRVAATERGLAGRVRRPADHQGLARIARRRASQHLPDPRFGARHQPGLGADVRHEGRGDQVRQGRQHRSGRPEGQVRAAQLESRRDHDDLPVHARRVRHARQGDLRAGA